MTNGPLYVTAQAPGVVIPGTTSIVTTSFTNGGDFAVGNVRMNLQAPSGWKVQSLSDPTLGSHAVSIYFASVSLQAGKTIQSISLPVNGNLHVFAPGSA